MSVIWRAKPEELQSVFRFDVQSLLEHSPYVWYVLSGYRGLQEQADLYQKHLAGGPRAAPPGASAHNYGLAVDVAPDVELDPGLQPSWDVQHSAAWKWLADAVDAHPRLHHGRSFGDWPHIERVNWKRYKTESRVA